MTDLVPLATLQAKLSSPNPEAKVAALMHLKARGTEARPAALEVVSLLKDESPSVAWHVPATFAALGEGAVEAVPALLTLLGEGRGSEDGMLCGRVLSCLAVVGHPAAEHALEPLLAWVGEDEQGAKALETLMRIAPVDERVVKAVIEVLLTEDSDRWTSAVQAVMTAGDELKAKVVELVLSRVQGAERVHAAALLAQLSTLNPKAMAEAANGLLDDKQEAVVRSALEVITKTGQGASADRLGKVLEEHPSFAKSVLQALAALGDEAAGGAGFVLPLLVEHDDMWVVGAAARILAATAPEIIGLEETLIARLEGALKSDGDSVEMYPLGDCAAALAIVGEGSEASSRVLRSAMQHAVASWKEGDDYKARDFLRKILQGLSAVGPAANVLLPDLLVLLDDTDLGSEVVEVMHILDLDESYREKVEKAGHVWDAQPAEEPASAPVKEALPPLPGDDVVTESMPAFTALSAEDLTDIQQAVEVAANNLGVLDAEPEKVVAAVRRWVAQQRSQEAEFDAEMAAMVSLLWGEQLVAACAWSWKNSLDGEQRFLAVASPDGAYACLPMGYLAALLEGGGDNTAELLFSMVFEGKLPPAHPGTVQFLG